ncbi:MAG: hypothetical protein WBO09_13685 [Methylocystis silviterrae]|uniref:hypothetical protein n=1 Tax=Methylocystis silviterrae TaxID=2743612 RepID=UPI003BBC67DC
MSEQPQFPPVIYIRGRKFFARSRLEHYKQSLLAAAMQVEAPPYAPPAVETFVAFREGCAELGRSTRTGDRYRLAARASVTESAAA